MILARPNLWVPWAAREGAKARRREGAGSRPRRPLEHLMSLAFRSGHLAWAGTGHLADGCGPTTVQQARYCPQPGGLAPLWIATSGLPSPFTSKYYVHVTGGGCYYFDPTDSPATYSSQPLIGAFTAVGSCADAACPAGVCGCQSGFALSTITATFSGVQFEPSCFNPASGGLWQFNSAPGTYTMTLSGCGANAADPSVATPYSSGGCAFPYTPTGGLGVQQVGGTKWRAQFVLGGGAGVSCIVFDSVPTPQGDCTQPIVLANIYQSYEDPAQFGQNSGWGGTCTLTFS